jgi:hypothetical protein
MPLTRLTPSYPINDGRMNTSANYRAMADLLDAYTCRRIEGLIGLDGARCADVVTGGGSIGLWLSFRVGEGGHVLMTDFNPTGVMNRRNLVYRKHDLTQDDVPGSGYDLIHARLVLGYLTMRNHILHRLIKALGKGGVLLTQDWWMTDEANFVIEAPDDGARELLEKTYATYLVVLRKFGYDSIWSRRSHDMMVESGLVDVVAEVHGSPAGDQWLGGSPGAMYMLHEFVKYRALLIANGVIPEQLDRVRRLLLDPMVVVRGHHLYSVSGRKPGTNPRTT